MNGRETHVYSNRPFKTRMFCITCSEIEKLYESSQKAYSINSLVVSSEPTIILPIFRDVSSDTVIFTCHISLICSITRSITFSVLVEALYLMRKCLLSSLFESSLSLDQLFRCNTFREIKAAIYDGKSIKAHPFAILSEIN